MRDLLSVLGVDRATVVGHSLGGGVAMQFAYQYPERCERLVLVSTGGVSNEVHPILRLASLPDADLLLPLVGFDLTRLAVRGVFLAFQKLGTDLGRDAADFLRVFDTLPDATSRSAFVRTLRAVDRPPRSGHHDARPLLPHARHADAARVGRSRRDHPLQSRAASRTPSMPGSRLETFENAGHFPHHAEPARFLAVLRDFLSTTSPPVHSSEQWRELLRRGKTAGPPLPPAGHSASGT